MPDDMEREEYGYDERTAAETARDAAPRRAQLAPPQRAFLGRLSRRTWAFFEVHMRAQDHWLPPDNVQEHPQLVVARRTSPTNIGLALLGNLAAYDLGYLQPGGVIERTRLTLATMETLPLGGHGRSR